ncbi:MFS transporter [Actinoplanes sp. NPDC051633]|uniref:MFS transporter n=1 Tax=Actinoplanes sp. NPDC051633 TaxID=3155670 RepID=UPI00341EFD8F
MTSSVTANSRPWAGLAVLVLPCLLVAMDAHVLNLAVPKIAADLRPSPAQLLWIVDGYVFLVAGALLAMGALGDRVGRRRLLLVGVSFFAVASLVAAFAGTATELVVARMLMGLAGASLMPSTLALIRGMFPDGRRRTVALGVWAASFSLGGLLGPVVGGVFLEAFWWGAVFLLAVPVAVLLLTLGPRLLPEFRQPEGDGFDVIGAAQSLVALLAIVYAIKHVAEGGGVTGTVAAAATGVLVGAAFVRRQRRRVRPMIDPAPFRAPTVRVALLANALTFFALYGTQVATARHLQVALGLSPLTAGLWTVPPTLAYLAATAVGPVAVRRFPPVRVIGVALLVIAAGYALIAVTGGVAGIVAGGIVVSFGLAPAFTLATDLVVAGAPPEQAGTAGAVSETGAELGGALGIALLGSLGVAVHRHVGLDESFAAITGAAALVAGAMAVIALRAARACGRRRENVVPVP